MGKSLHQQVSFAGGEFSPKLDARVDSAKYASALRKCYNMLAFKTGGLTRRPGTQMIAQAKYANTPGHNYSVRMLSFTFSPTTTFELEFGNHYIRFYSNGQQVVVNSAAAWVSGKYYYSGNYVTDPFNSLIYLCIQDHSGAVQPHSAPSFWTQQQILEIPNTPYGADALTGSIYDTDIWKIAKCEINDVVYLAHPDYPPYKLTRFADTDWLLEQVVFNTPALLDQNATDTVITPSAVQGSVTLTATAPAWVTAHFYNLNNSVQDSGTIYNCIQAHVSGVSFAVGLSSGYWEAVVIFNPGIAGSTWQLATLRNAASVEYSGTAAGGFSAGVSDIVQCRGTWEVHSYGVWNADVAIERSLDQGLTWDTVLTVTGRDDRNLDAEGKAEILGWYRINVSNVTAPVAPGVTDPRIVFESVDAFLYGLVEITGVPPGGYTAVGTVVTQISDSNPMQPQWVSGQAYLAADDVSYQFVNYTAINPVTSATPPPQDPTNWALTAPGGTEYWSEAAWSGFRGYPQAVTSFQQRVIYGGSGFEPQRIWGTVTNDIENFFLGDQTLATDAFVFDLNAPSRGPIAWLIGQLDLFVGFSGAEWVVNSGSTNQSGGGSGAAVTATSINAVEHSSWGSAPYVTPAIVGDAMMFTQRQSTTLRQMMFSVYTDKYMSQDLTTLSDHLFPSGIVQIAYQARWRKQSLVWAVTKQGTLCGMTYELDQEVFGWHRHQTGYDQTDPDGDPITPDNGFESVSVITGQGTADDEVWLVANRLIGGVQTRFIERMNPINWEETFTSAPNPAVPVLADAFYVDCGVTITNQVTLAISGLSYLEGRFLYGLADGSAFGPIEVIGGTATLPDAFVTPIAKVQIGLPVKYAGQPMRNDQDPRQGNTQGLEKLTSDLYLRLMNSAGGSISNGTTDTGINTPVPIAYGTTLTGPTMITLPEDRRVTPKGQPTITADPIIIVQGNDALPITVLALIRKYEVTGTP